MFGKKVTAEELLKLYSALSDEEKQKFLGSVNSTAEESAKDGEQSGTEEETPNPEPTAAASPEKKPDVGDTGNADTETPSGTTAEEPAVPPAEEPAADNAPAPDAQTQDNVAEILEGLGARMQAVEQALKELNELKKLMQEYTAAQADKIGYKGTVPGAKKDYKEMSADELKKEILTGGQ